MWPRSNCYKLQIYELQIKQNLDVVSFAGWVFWSVAVKWVCGGQRCWTPQRSSNPQQRWTQGHQRRKAVVKDPHSQLTWCLPLEAESTSVSVNWTGKEHLKNLWAGPKEQRVKVSWDQGGEPAGSLKKEGLKEWLQQQSRNENHSSQPLIPGL